MLRNTGSSAPIRRSCYHYASGNQLGSIDLGDLESAPLLTLGYDAIGRLATRTDADRGSEVYHFDAYDELTHRTDGNSRETQYFYDDLGRLDHFENSDGVTRFTYDGSGPNEIGRLVQASSPSGATTRFEYEPPLANQNRGLPMRTTREILGRSYVTELSHDVHSRLDTITYPESAPLRDRLPGSRHSSRPTERSGSLVSS